MLGINDNKKIIVLGNPGVGKTSIIQRYVHNQFKENYNATLGFNIYSRFVTIGENKACLSIWDIGGQEAFKKFAFRYLVEADAVIFVADVTHPESIDDLVLWNEKLCQVLNRKIPKIVLFNKVDLKYNVGEISERLIKSTIRSQLNGIVFASAKTGQNIVDIFTMIANMLINWDEEFNIPKKQEIQAIDVFEDTNLSVVFFSSDFCTWCKPVFDSLNKIANEIPFTVKVIDVERNQKIAQEHGVVSLPTTIIGSKIFVGELEEEILRAFINDAYFEQYIK